MEIRDGVTYQGISALLGSLFLALMSQLAITLPWTPVPVSLQSLAVFLLAITLGRGAWLPVIMWLSEASMGFPVLAGGVSNAIWIVKPTAGYLVSFVITAYFLGNCFAKQKNITSWWRSLLALIVAQAVIWALGTIWLAQFVGWSKAYALGVEPFYVGAGIKIFVALGFIYPIIFWKKWFRNRWQP